MHLFVQINFLEHLKASTLASLLLVSGNIKEQPYLLQDCLTRVCTRYEFWGSCENKLTFLEVVTAWAVTMNFYERKQWNDLYRNQLQILPIMLHYCKRYVSVGKCK